MRSINKLFRAKPSINCIAFLGMSIASPGMEIHSQELHSDYYENYKVVKFSKTGKIKIFDKFYPY